MVLLIGEFRLNHRGPNIYKILVLGMTLTTLCEGSFCIKRQFFVFGSGCEVSDVDTQTIKPTSVFRVMPVFNCFLTWMCSWVPTTVGVQDIPFFVDGGRDEKAHPE